jgi:histidine ammonia-lyase
MPASVFSRSTECHNQDKVSLGTIAARDCLRIIELTEQVAAVCLLACVQAVELRGGLVELGTTMQKTITDLREHVAALTSDRAMEADLRVCLELIHQQHWQLYD